MRAFSMIAAMSVPFALSTSAALAGPQDQTLRQAKDLYAQAAYEQALGVLSNLAGSEPATEAASYRAACLLALGRAEDARKAVDEVVREHPGYLPDPADTSPRVMDLFRSTRRARLPEVARRLYAEAKTAMESNDLDGAIQRFEKVIGLTGDVDSSSDTVLSELRMLATEFLELARTRAAAKSQTPPGSAPLPAPAPPPVITASIPLNQKLPAWTPRDTVGRVQEFSGAVRVEIGVDGKVTSAKIEKSVHPAYDAQLLAAAAGWLYEPARRDGVPVASSRTVEVVLKPR